MILKYLDNLQGKLKEQKFKNSFETKKTSQNSYL